MLLRYFYDEKLAQASYLVGCQATGEAVVIDPSRNIDPYLETAAKEGMNIVGSLETHIHADFLSGTLELVTRTGVVAYLSDEGGPDWKYQFVDHIDHRLLKDGDTFTIGNLRFEVMHTPGHTPEHICFLLTDKEGQQPVGLFTGDFVFVGDVGRPDLLEKAAGVSGTAEKGARQMFRSLKRFKELPDSVQIWPAHGAGSACGKALGAIPTSTVGYEKQHNWALQYTDEEAFVQDLLDNQPEPPKYFAMMKKMNKDGPALLQQQNVVLPLWPTKKTFEKWLNDDHVVIIDTRPFQSYAQSHIPGTLNIPFESSFTNWIGWLVNYEQEVYLIAEQKHIQDLLLAFYSIGLDTVKGYMPPSIITKLNREGLKAEKYAQASPKEIAEQILSGLMPERFKSGYSR
ncbi:Zn-dependent hydrolase [Caldalkalibacillus thermarum]|nr:Zn-dependent hydrolase [Caldalkalibacillus thermarum]